DSDHGNGGDIDIGQQGDRDLPDAEYGQQKDGQEGHQDRNRLMYQKSDHLLIFSLEIKTFFKMIKICLIFPFAGDPGGGYQHSMYSSIIKPRPFLLSLIIDSKR